MPAAVSFEQGIGRDDHLSHDRGDGDFRGFSGGDQLLVFGLEIGVVASGDECQHVEGLPDVGTPSADEALTFPLAGLSRYWRQPGQRCRLLAVKTAHSGIVAISWLAVKAPPPAMLVRI